MATPTFTLCVFCKHRTPKQRTCAAYPDGIPLPILLGKEIHVAPVDGDHGIQFEPADDLAESEKRIVASLIRDQTKPAPQALELTSERDRQG